MKTHAPVEPKRSAGHLWSMIEATTMGRLTMTRTASRQAVSAMDEPTREGVTKDLRDFFDVASGREMHIEGLMRELSELIGRDRTTIYRWRSGDRKMSSAAARLLHRKLAFMRKKYDIG